MRRKLQAVLQGISCRDAAILDDWCMWDSVGFVQGASAVIPMRDVLPWPVALAIAANSRKHRLQSGSLPSWHTVVDGVSQFVAKIKWASYHKNSASSQERYSRKNILGAYCFHVASICMHIVCILHNRCLEMLKTP